MPFGLKNAPTILLRVVVAFKEFIHKFLEVYLDDWNVFSLLKNHIEVLRLMLDRCRQCHISLNLKKCIFCVPFGLKNALAVFSRVVVAAFKEFIHKFL